MALREVLVTYFAPLFQADPRLLLFFIAVITSPLVDEEGWIPTPRDWLQRFIRWQRSAAETLQELQRLLLSFGVRMEIREFCARTHCRAVRLEMDGAVQAALLHAQSLVRSPQCDLFTGRAVSDRTLRRWAQQRREAAGAAATGPRLRFYFDRSPQIASHRRQVRKNIDAAVEAVMERTAEDDPEVAQRRTGPVLAVLNEVQRTPYFAPRTSTAGLSHRIVAPGSIQQLPAAVRRALFPDSVMLDLVACHPSIFAVVAGAQIAQAHFAQCAETRTDPYQDICAFVCGKDARQRTIGRVRTVVKKTIAAIDCGLSYAAARVRLQQALRRVIDEPARLLRHPVVVDLLAARDRLFGQIEAQGYVDTPKGRITVPGHGRLPAEEYEAAIRRHVSCFVDGIEAEVIVALTRYVGRHQSAMRVLGDFHDAIMVRLPSAIRCPGVADRSIAACARAVRRIAKQAGVPVWLKADEDAHGVRAYYLDHKARAAERTVQQRMGRRRAERMRFLSSAGTCLDSGQCVILSTT